MSRTYSKQKCHICGRMVSSAGCAWANHQKKHDRERQRRYEAHQQYRKDYDAGKQ